MIRSVSDKDVAQIISIYNYYVKNTAITFEENCITADDMLLRMHEYTKEYPWLVYEDNGKVIGYCYATKWRIRSAYKHSAELTVYVEKDHHGKCIGTKLYGELIKLCRKKGLHVLVAGIALPNEKSQGLHEKMGFKKVAQFEEIGRKFDRWIDVGYWEYKL